MSRRHDHAAWVLNLLQLIIDSCGAIGGFALALWLYRGAPVLQEISKSHNHQFTPEGETYYAITGVFAALVLLSFAVKGLYQTRETGLMNMDEATGVLQALFFASAAVVAGT